MKAIPSDARLCVYSHSRGWTPIREGIESLAPRELEVLKLLAHGFERKDVAKQLHISRKTISTYRERIFEKLHLKTMSELIHYALFHGVVENVYDRRAKKCPEARVLHLPNSRAVA